MTAPWMPPLPRQQSLPIDYGRFAAQPGMCFGYTTDQMRQAQADAARAALEEAARVCDSVNNYDNPMTATDCADAIRALAKEIT